MKALLGISSSRSASRSHAHLGSWRQRTGHKASIGPCMCLRRPEMQMMSLLIHQAYCPRASRPCSLLVLFIVALRTLARSYMVKKCEMPLVLASAAAHRWPRGVAEAHVEAGGARLVDAIALHVKRYVRNAAAAPAKQVASELKWAASWVTGPQAPSLSRRHASSASCAA
jgi:hypothetical protein